MRPFGPLLAAVLLVQAAVFLQSPSPSGAEPVPSTAQSYLQVKRNLRDARRGMELLRVHMAHLEDAEGMPLEPITVAFPDSDLAGRCIPAEPVSHVFPVLACEYGPTDQRPMTQALFWRRGSSWESQLYPTAPERIAGDRRRLFDGRRCPGGCLASIRRLRIARNQSGQLEALVVADIGTPAVPMEEVHLLQLGGGGWTTVWMPGPGDWNWGHARVEIVDPALSGFAVRSSSWGRQDRFAGYLAEPPEGEHRWFRERWVRKGDGYILRDQVEEPGAYGVLVRLVYYVSHHDDQRARQLLGSDLPLAEAQKALSQSPVSMGWGVERTGTDAFLLDKDGDRRPEMAVWFRQEGTRWLLVRITPGTPNGSGLGAPSPQGHSQKNSEGQRKEAGPDQ